MFWLPAAAFDSFRDRATDQCGVDRVWWNNTFSEEFTSWTKLEMWMCLGQPAVALVSFTFSMFNTKYAAISQGDSPSLIGELREKCKLTWRAMKESLIKLKKILMCCYNHNILSFTGTWYPFLSFSGIESRCCSFVNHQNPILNLFIACNIYYDAQCCGIGNCKGWSF